VVDADGRRGFQEEKRPTFQDTETWTTPVFLGGAMLVRDAGEPDATANRSEPPSRNQIATEAKKPRKVAEIGCTLRAAHAALGRAELFSDRNFNMAKTAKKKAVKITASSKRRSRGDTVKTIAAATDLKTSQVRSVFDTHADHRGRSCQGQRRVQLQRADEAQDREEARDVRAQGPQPVHG
jgi:hypothetical protein